MQLADCSGRRLIDALVVGSRRLPIWRRRGSPESLFVVFFTGSGLARVEPADVREQFEDAPWVIRCWPPSGRVERLFECAGWSVGALHVRVVGPEHGRFAYPSR